MAVLEKKTGEVYTKGKLDQLMKYGISMKSLKGTLGDILINSTGSAIGDYGAVATVPTEPGNLNNTYWVMDKTINVPLEYTDVRDGSTIGSGVRGVILDHDFGDSIPLHDNGLIAIEKSPTYQWLNSHFAPAYLNLRSALAIWTFLAVYNTIRAVLNKNPYTKRARWAIAGVSIGGATASGVSYWYLFKGSKDIAGTVTGNHYGNFDEAWDVVHTMLKYKMVPFWDTMALIGNILKYLGYAFSAGAPVALYIHTDRIEKKIRKEIDLRL